MPIHVDCPSCGTALKVKDEFAMLSQSQYSFSNSGYYVAVMLTSEYGKPNEELSTMIKTLTLGEPDVIDQLLEYDG